MSNIAVLTGRLQGLKAKGQGKWVAKCPAHQDKTPSLAVRDLGDGRVLVHCFGGCDPDSVMGALGMSLADLMPERIEQFIPGVPRPFQYAAEEILAKSGRHMMRVLIAAEMTAKGEVLTEKDLQLLWSSAGELRQYVLAASTIHRQLAS